MDGSCFQPFARPDKFRGLQLEGIGSGEKIRFVRTQKFKYSGEGGAITEAGTQRIGGEPCEREKSVCAFLLVKHPAESGERKGMGMVSER